MKTRLFVLVTLFMMLFSASAFADVSGGSITKLRNTSDGQKIVIFTQEGYSVASVLEFVANKPMQASNVIEAVNAYLTSPAKCGFWMNTPTPPTTTSRSNTPI